MKIVIFVMMTFAQSALCAELLTPNHLFYTSEQSDEFAFESGDKTAFCKIRPQTKRAFIACKALSFWAYTRQGQI